ncbi:MAG: D-alanyl-D-alanine carboxypeptidase/D-alanyl-D-alanine-endopeptidase [Rhodoferax sp.]
MPSSLLSLRYAPWRARLRAIALVAASCWAGACLGADGLPVAFDTALARARVPRDAVSIVVAEAQPGGATVWSHRAQAAMNPASVMKLVTTYAALDQLGPAFTWATPVYVEGTVRDGTLTGRLWIQGQGDPHLVLENLWLLLRRVQQGLGIERIVGDIVLDNTAFAPSPTQPGDFDGEPLSAYNAAPDALLINFKSVLLTVTPDPAQGVAHLQWDPPLAGVQMPRTVALSNGDCGDYRAALKADFTDPLRFRLLGSYAAACKEKTWPFAYADPANYAPRAVQGLWQSMGGQLQGSVRLGALPALASGWQPALVARSASLAEIVRDINKYSNNVMAQQLFLTLGRAASGTSADLPSARAALLTWWQQRLGSVEPPVLDNGSGLSRSERISAQALARLLQTAHASTLMPELMASLPIYGVDGTLRRVPQAVGGGAHLKTGSLADVTALGGYVHAASGKRYVLVAIVNHANARAARTALQTLVQAAIAL